jgi:microcystin-dependent protein
MADPFVAEIRIFAGNFAPSGWAFCDGQLMPISQNTALFSLVGNIYGGDGMSNFGLPNLQGASPLQTGQGPGLSYRDIGQTGGQQAVTLTTQQIPSHTHTVECVTSAGSLASPAAAIWAAAPRGRGNIYAPANANTPAPMSPLSLAPTGGNQAHNNMPPFLALTFIIALQGIFPQRP